MKRHGLLLLGMVATTSCEFGETTISESEPIVVVHAVMRPDLDRQWVIVEQTLTGSESEESVGGRIPGNPPQLPLTGATVTVINLTMPGDPCGAVFFTENPTDPSLETSAGLYWGPAGCPTMQVGDTLMLTVRTIEGETVTGTTEIPEAEGMFLRVAGDSVRVPGPTLTMNRDADTLEAEVVVTVGRGTQLEVGSPDSTGRVQRPFAMFVDSTSITLPGDLPNFLLGLLGEEDTTSADDVEPIFTAGRYYIATVALFDDRYFDYARSGNTPLSGRGYINSIQGGMGVFGSMVAATNQLKVVGDLDDEREGFYEMVGEVDGVAVDVMLELYVAAAGEDTTGLSTFVAGDWVLGPVDTHAEGQFTGSEMWFVLYQAPPGQPEAPNAYMVLANLLPDGTFSGEVLDRDLNVIGSVTGTKAPPLIHAS